MFHLFIKWNGIHKVRQIVILGESNENQIIIKKGLEEGDKVLLTIPVSGEKLKYSGKELILEIKKEKERKRKEAIEKARNKPKISSRKANVNSINNSPFIVPRVPSGKGKPAVRIIIKQQ